MSKPLRKQIENAVQRITVSGRESGALFFAKKLYMVARVGPSFSRKFTGVTDTQAAEQLRKLAETTDAFIDALRGCSNFNAFNALEEVVKRTDLTCARSIPNPLVLLENTEPMILLSNEDWPEISRIARDAAEELERGGNKRQGNKRDPYAMLIAMEAAKTYEKATGKSPGSGYDHGGRNHKGTGNRSGPFYKFAEEIFEILEITPAPIRIILKAAKEHPFGDMDGIAEK